MTIRNYLICLSLLFTLLGSLFLVVGNFKSATDIVKESGTYWGGNLAIRISLISARIYSVVGFFVLGFGIVLQVISIFTLEKKMSLGVALGTLLIVFGIAVLSTTSS